MLWFFTLFVGHLQGLVALQADLCRPTFGPGQSLTMKLAGVDRKHPPGRPDSKGRAWMGAGCTLSACARNQECVTV